MSASSPSRSFAQLTSEPLGFARRFPLWLGASILPLLSLSLVWSAFPNFLSWRHTQLLAGTVGGLTLLLLRLLTPNARGSSAGRTPMAVTMFAMISMSLLAWMSGHAQLWHGAMVVLMLTGVTAWLWYPPEFFSPFRAAAHASIALAVAILVPFYAELFAISPWHAALEGSTHRVLRGAFDTSRTLSTASFLTAMSLIVAAWPNPKVPVISRRIAQGILVLLSVTALLWISPIYFPARLSIALVALVGVFWRPQRDFKDTSTSPRYRWGSIIAVFGVLIVFTLPPVLSQDSPYAAANTAETTHTPAPTAGSADPVPSDLERIMRRAEWKSAWQNLPFGAGVGARTAPSLQELHPASAEDTLTLHPTLQTSQSMLATQMAEQGVMALFVWVLITAGGFLLARLVMLHSNFPPVIAQVLGVTPGVTLAFLPGGTQMAPALAMILAWFLLCAPLAQAEARRAQRLVPGPSTPEDERRAPRGRILLLLIAGVAITWFSIANTRWSHEAHQAYAAHTAGDLDDAYTHLQRANSLLPNAYTLLDEAQLLERFSRDSTQKIEALYRAALAHRPQSERIHTAHAQWILRWHQRASDPAFEGGSVPDMEYLESALFDIDVANRSEAPASILSALHLELLILLDEIDAAESAYALSMDTVLENDQRQALRILYARMLAWKSTDFAAAYAVLDEAHQDAQSDEERAQLQEERARLKALETAQTPYSAHDFHEGHGH